MIRFAEGGIVGSRWRTFENIAVLARTESSNDLARELIEIYFDEEENLPPTILLADRQTAARGRTGAWHAPADRGLYFTFIVPLSGAPLSVVPIAVARWTREALREATGLVADLKWPNDLYSGRRKLAGILPEARTQGHETMVAVGVGMNVSGTAASLGVPGATTVEEELGRPVPRARLLQTILDTIDHELADPHWDREVDGWERASLHRPGDRMTIRREGGEVRGEYLGLDPAGFLRLRTESGEAVLPGGEVAEW
jgi:BirA family transcriptional regulator, biotin operon repressor / biotin---[acetyl-CoA-carboxylase] ligase